MLTKLIGVVCIKRKVADMKRQIEITVSNSIRVSAPQTHNTLMRFRSSTNVGKGIFGRRLTITGCKANRMRFRFSEVVGEIYK